MVGASQYNEVNSPGVVVHVDGCAAASQFACLNQSPVRRQEHIAGCFCGIDIDHVCTRIREDLTEKIPLAKLNAVKNTSSFQTTLVAWVVVIDLNTISVVAQQFYVFHSSRIFRAETGANPFDEHQCVNVIKPSSVMKVCFQYFSPVLKKY